MNKNTQRNSILEIFRLCASLWVMYYHGYSLITRTQMFTNGRIAVDFFFILSGMFFLNSLNKLTKTNNFVKDTVKFVWLKFKPMMITFLICLVFSIIGYIKFYDGFFNSSIWGYLWYIPHLLLVFAVYFILKRIVQDKKWFNIFTTAIVILCLVVTLGRFSDYGLFRGFAGVGLGILISQIPTVWKFKTGKVLSILMCLLSFLSIFVISVLHPDTLIQDCLCILLLFPTLIYFSAQIPFSNVYINNISSISLGLYTYQTVASLLEDCLILTSGKILFVIVLVLAIIDVAVKKTLKNYKKNKKTNFY